MDSLFKAGPLRLKQLTNTLKIRILSETSILYLIRYASIILIVGLHLYRRILTSEHCWKKNSGIERARTSIVQHSRSSFRRSTICAIASIRNTGYYLAKCRQLINIKRGCAMRKRGCVILI